MLLSVAVASSVFAGSVSAQTSDPSVSVETEPAVTAAAPENPPAPISVPDDSTVESTSAPSTTVTKCDVPPPLAASFIGRLVGRAEPILTFEVVEIREGTLAAVVGDRVEVDFTGDGRFLDNDSTYLVAVAIDPASQSLVSKVRVPKGSVARCLLNDLIYTHQADGSQIDTGVFAGMHGNWKLVPLAFLYPLGGAIGLLVVLVVLRHMFGWTIRRTAVRWAHVIGDRLRARHEPTPSPPPNPESNAPAVR